MQTSFVTTSFLGRELAYNVTDGMAQADQATNRAFRPAETFVERFEGMLEEVAELGFDTIGLWTAHLSWAWATDDQISAAKMILAKQGLRVWSYDGYFGSNPEQFAKACRLAKTLGASVLAGNSPVFSTPEGIQILREHGLKYGYENHAEKTAEEVLKRIGDVDVIGTTVDTGWWATQGADPVEMIHRLGSRIVAVHLKDVRAAGSHEPCQFGKGIVRIRECVQALREVGFTGPIGIEHFPERYDPRKEIEANLRFLG
jgi:sugar phosphate isomerase/epimerase